jgi:hypothetical protein
MPVDRELIPYARSRAELESLVARVSKADVVEEPFPHVVVREPLDPNLCDRLIAEFPSLDVISEGRPHKSNQRLNYRARRATDDPLLSPLWREMVATHVSQGFLDQLLGLFGESIRRTYPSFERTIGPPESLRAGVRYIDTFETADVLLEAQPAMNTPVTAAPSSVRAGHLDNANKLIVGLYYLRHPDDDSTGGELELYRYATRRPVFEGHEISHRCIESVKTIPYEKNVLFLFLNTAHSLHGVTVRQPTPWARLFFNLGAEVRTDLFAIPTPWPRRVARRARATARRVVRAART